MFGPDNKTSTDLKKQVREAMRVTICCDCNSKGGVWVYSMALIRCLVSRGVMTSVITLEPEGAAMKDNWHQLVDHVHDERTIRRQKDENGLFKDIAEGVISLAPQVVVPNYRVAFYHGAALATRKIDTRIIGVCHNDHRDNYTLLGWYRPVISRFVCAAEKTKIRLGELIGRPRDIDYIPHGVEKLTAQCPTFEGGEIRILYHGRIVAEQKCVMEMLKVARRLLDDGVRYKLTLVGDGENWAEVQRAIQEIGLAGTTTLLPGKKRSEIGSLISGSHLAILTSKYEGFCLGLAEAMLAGLPAVIFECGGVPEEYVRDGVNGFVRPWGDAEGLSKCIRALQSDPEMWKRFSNAASQEIEAKYNWKKAGEMYEYVFREALSKPRRVWDWRNELGRKLVSLRERQQVFGHVRSLFRF